MSITTDRERHPAARRMTWFVSIWAASVVATVAVAYALRLVIFRM